MGKPGLARTLPARFAAKYRIDPETGCWNWTAYRTPAGYGRMLGSKAHVEEAHRVSYELHIGPIPWGLHVLHSCDNRACVNPAHLSVGTHQDNMRDCKTKKRFAWGEKHGRSKLTSAQVAFIRERIVVHGDISGVAAELGVTPTHVAVVACGVWRKDG